MLLLLLLQSCSDGAQALSPNPLTLSSRAKSKGRLVPGM